MVKNIFMFAFILFMGIGGCLSPVFADSDRPTEGCLKVVSDNGSIFCPLEHTYVSADISGFTGKVTVEQKFKNDTGKPIEAEYIFPLPEMAAVDSMVMKIGDKTVRAEIKKKEEAQKIYDDAKNSGKRTALLTQERTNIFTQRVANIMPNDSIIIKITYVETIKYKDGTYEFVFPMVVGPRYIPKDDFDKSPVTDEEEHRIIEEQSESGWKIDKSRLEKSGKINPPIIPEGMRTGHDISINVNVKSPISVKKTECLLHKVSINKKNECEFSVKLDDSDNIPNKDFILRYTTAGNNIEEGIISHIDSAKGGFFSLYIQPPQRPSVSQIYPKEMIFVVDNSGSQRGKPIEKAKETMKYCIDNMNPNDTFNIIAFSSRIEPLFETPMKNTPETREKAQNFIEALKGQGGTEMLMPMKKALCLKEDPHRLRIVTLMTDGYIGNDRVVCDVVQKNIGNARVFVFGTGNSVNRFLVEKMAKVGRGEAEIITLSSEGKKVAESFYKKISCPLMTDIKVDFGKLPVKDVLPENRIDLFSSKPIVFIGRYSKASKGTVSISGISAGRPFSKKIDIFLPEKEDANSSLPVLWARTKIESLSDKDLSNVGSEKADEDIKKEITKLGLDYSLVTDYTSFVAVEEKIVNKDGKTEKISVPVEMPDGVSYEGVFGSDNDDVVSFAGNRMKLSSGVNASSARCCEDGCAENTVCLSMPTVNRPAKKYVNRKYANNTVKYSESIQSLKTLIDSGWKIDKDYTSIPTDVLNKNKTLLGLERVCFENGKVYAAVFFSCSKDRAEKICKHLGIEIIKPAKKSGYKVGFYILSKPDKLFKLENNKDVIAIIDADKKKLN